MYTLVKEGSFRINAKLVKEELMEYAGLEMCIVMGKEGWFTPGVQKASKYDLLVLTSTTQNYQSDKSNTAKDVVSSASSPADSPSLTNQIGWYSNYCQFC